MRIGVRRACGVRIGVGRECGRREDTLHILPPSLTFTPTLWLPYLHPHTQPQFFRTTQVGGRVGIVEHTDYQDGWKWESRDADRRA